MGVNVLVVGSGGREHALVWKLSKSPGVRKIYVAPGNAGTGKLAQNLPIKATDIKALGDAAQALDIDLVVVGPEAPLAAGLVDHLSRLGIPAFGPSQQAAEIESSKVFSRRLMEKYNIPCPKGMVFESYEDACSYVKRLSPPVVVKADGLAGGKGVVVAESTEEAISHLHKLMIEKVFGEAGRRVIIDERLYGREASLLAFTDGKTVIPMVPACDYKPVFDENKGPNTGGMGGYSPPPFFTQQLVRECTEKIMIPAIEAMAKEGRVYKGVLYGGLIITDEGPKVLEFNSRFGDPENQVIMPRLKSDLLEIMFSVVEGRLGGMRLEWEKQACVGVVLASQGYPGSYKTGFPIRGLESLPQDIILFHAGTKEDGGIVYTDGGRVLTVVAKGKDLREARDKVYNNIPLIYFEGMHYRKDIALEECL